MKLLTVICIANIVDYIYHVHKSIQHNILSKKMQIVIHAAKSYMHSFFQLLSHLNPSIICELSFLGTVYVYIQQMDFNEIEVGTRKAPVIFGSNLDYNIDNGYILYGSSPADDLHFL